jgi:integration host factor subunit beta
MTKSELKEALSTELTLPSQTASSIIDTIIDSMTETLVNGDNIELRGFGSFTIKHYDSYAGRNPKTGEETLVKAKKLPFFRVGKDLREAVNENAQS